MTTSPEAKPTDEVNAGRDCVTGYGFRQPLHLSSLFPKPSLGASFRCPELPKYRIKTCGRGLLSDLL